MNNQGTPLYPLSRLTACPESKNPVMGLYDELRDVDPRCLSTDDALALDARIEAVLQEGDVQCAMIEKCEKRLKAARAVPAKHIPEGF